ncbi:MAG TPA: hydroxyisourate hydrolase [Polyangiaceae bacterium]|nr:hydroxyisourate hydrolase [Polyangiaceae bacterium]
MTRITTHVLDVATGEPAVGLLVRLARLAGDTWLPLGEARTDQDGRVSAFTSPESVRNAGGAVPEPGRGSEPPQYRLSFDARGYFASSQRASFYGWIEIAFYDQGSDHYHVPLLLSPYGYSTYRGR